MLLEAGMHETGSHHVEVQLLDDNGRKWFSAVNEDLRLHSIEGRTCGLIRFIFPINGLVLLSPGQYTWRVWIDGELDEHESYFFYELR